MTEHREEKCCVRFTAAPQIPVVFSEIAANVPQVSDEFRLLLFSGLVGRPKPFFERLSESGLCSLELGDTMLAPSP